MYSKTIWVTAWKNRPCKQWSGCLRISLIHKRSPLLMLFLFSCILPPCHSGCQQLLAIPYCLGRNLLSWWDSPSPHHAQGGTGRIWCGGSGLLPISRPLPCSPPYLGLPASEYIARRRILSHLKENFPLQRKTAMSPHWLFVFSENGTGYPKISEISLKPELCVLETICKKVLGWIFSRCRII